MATLRAMLSEWERAAAHTILMETAHANSDIDDVENRYASAQALHYLQSLVTPFTLLDLVRLVRDELDTVPLEVTP